MLGSIISNPNLRAWITTGLGCGAYVGLTAFIGKKKILPERLSRKLMHIGCGPLFVLCWPLYTVSPASPFLAASIPFLASVQFALVGTGALPDILGLIPGVTRSGNCRELLHGPFIYGLVHAACAVIAWRRPEAVLAVSMLCGGDGLAEVVGASVASPKLPWNRNKSVAGSIACFIGGTVLGMAMLRHFYSFNLATLGNNYQVDLARVASCALIGTLIESLPISVYEGADNLTVPLSVLLTGKFLL